MRIIRHPYIVTIVIIAAAAALRLWPLAALETRAPWITFYPAVMGAALYGGLASGFLGASMACLVVKWGWQWISPNPFINDFADWLGMGVFFVNCVFISFITEAMRQAREREKEAREQAEAASRAKTVFLSNMSHELRTPLNAVLGFSTLMRRDGNITAEQGAYLDIINRSGENLLSLINNILDMSRIESGRLALENTDTDLHQLIHQVQGLLSFRAAEKALAFTTSLAPDLPRYVVVDAVKLSQVLINLAGNAVKYTGSGGITLRAFTLPGHEEGKVRFEVEDTGPGIRKEDRDRIFLPFVQLRDRLPSETGSGLGLTISRQMVELMGGRIGVEGEPGKGSLFFFEIPVARQAGDSFRPLLQQGQVTGLAAGQPSFRLLIAEDQPENRLLLIQLLKPLGFELREAVNGEEALSLHREWHPHLVWMDIRMPVMDGLEATRHIRAGEQGARTPIIALTAHALEEERLEILEAGCDDFIRKPYRDEEIYGALEKYLGVRFARNEAESGEPRPAFELDQHALGRLPGDLANELISAAELLDLSQCREAASRIGELEPALGEQVLRLAENLHFGEILAALDYMAARRNDE